MMGKCKKCGSQYKQGDTFCASCGSKVAAEKSKPVEKKTVPTPEPAAPPAKTPPPKIEKSELNEDVKLKIRAELETAIKAFKKGDITLEEFQDMKKGIIAKAKAGGFDGKKDFTPPKVPEDITQTLAPQYADVPRGELHKPLRRNDEPLFSKIWYLLPIVLNLLGGLIAYFSLKKQDSDGAKNMLIIGLVSLVITGAAGGFLLKENEMWPFEKKVDVPEGIIIDGTPITNSAEPLVATNSTAEEMNLKADDLGGDFQVDNILTGTLKDPLEFSSGNVTLANELEAGGWIENHRIVLKKEFSDGAADEATVEKVVDISISKYNATVSSSVFFKEQERAFVEEFNNSGYTFQEMAINDSGFIGKKVEADPTYEVKVTYKVVFYRHDAIVKISVSKLGRGLEEDEVEGYAQRIEERIV